MTAGRIRESMGSELPHQENDQRDSHVQKVDLHPSGLGEPDCRGDPRDVFEQVAEPPRLFHAGRVGGKRRGRGEIAPGRVFPVLDRGERVEGFRGGFFI